MAIRIEQVDAGSEAEALGLAPGDELLSVDDNELNDTLDYDFYTDSSSFHLKARVADGIREWEVQRPQRGPFGCGFKTYLGDAKHSCSNHCMFCFIDQLPPGMRESLYFKDDDERLSFLFGNYITMTNMQDHEIDRIIKMHISPINISVADPALREQNVALMERMIRLASIFGPQRLVLHPISEPIADEEREIRLQNSANSIGRLALSAKESGAVLCIENLPRTCLGRDSGELMRLIADYPEVMVCFDSNHLLKEEHAHFFEAVGNRIGTIHASDYDRKDERHWLPGEGVIDWPDFLRRLQASGYKGVFMHEVRAGETATPENIVKTYNEVILGNKKK